VAERCRLVLPAADWDKQIIHSIVVAPRTAALCRGLFARVSRDYTHSRIAQTLSSCTQIVLQSKTR
jgi:hypothetical protein